jgi:hypothetical protein
MIQKALEIQLKDWLKKKKLIVVKWNDASSQDPWHSVSGERTTVQPCVTVGILVDADSEGIVVTHTLGYSDADETACCSIAIPQGCIIEAYELKQSLVREIPSRRPRKCKK